MLDKILEEIEKQKSCCLMIGYAKEYNQGALKMAEVIEDIIRKHMNDGWIPVEKRLPEEHEESRDRLDTDTLAVIDTEHNMVSNLVQCTVYDSRKDEYFVCDDCTVNGKWCNFEEVTGTYKVIAWRPHPEPYRPEKGAEE